QYPQVGTPVIATTGVPGGRGGRPGTRTGPPELRWGVKSLTRAVSALRAVAHPGQQGRGDHRCGHGVFPRVPRARRRPRPPRPPPQAAAWASASNTMWNRFMARWVTHLAGAIA